MYKFFLSSVAVPVQDTYSDRIQSINKLHFVILSTDIDIIMECAKKNVSKKAECRNFVRHVGSII